MGDRAVGIVRETNLGVRVCKIGGLGVGGRKDDVEAAAAAGAVVEDSEEERMRDVIAVHMHGTTLPIYPADQRKEREKAVRVRDFTAFSTPTHLTKKARTDRGTGTCIYRQ